MKSFPKFLLSSILFLNATALLAMDPMALEKGGEALGEELGVFGKRTIAAETTSVEGASASAGRTEIVNAIPSSNVLRLRGGGPKKSQPTGGLKSTGDSSDEEGSDEGAADPSLESEDTQPMSSEVSKYLKKEIINNIYEECLAEVAKLTMNGRVTTESSSKEAAEWVAAEKAAEHSKGQAERTLEKARIAIEEARRIAEEAKRKLKVAARVPLEGSAAEQAVITATINYEKARMAYTTADYEAKKLAGSLAEARVETADDVLHAISVRNTKQQAAAEEELAEAKEVELTAAQAVEAAKSDVDEKAALMKGAEANLNEAKQAAQGTSRSNGNNSPVAPPMTAAQRAALREVEQDKVAAEEVRAKAKKAEIAANRMKAKIHEMNFEKELQAYHEAEEVWGETVEGYKNARAHAQEAGLDEEELALSVAKAEVQQASWRADARWVKARQADQMVAKASGSISSLVAAQTAWSDAAEGYKMGIVKATQSNLKCVELTTSLNNAMKAQVKYIIEGKRKEAEMAFLQAQRNESENTWNEAARVARGISDYWNGVIQEIKDGSCSLALTEPEAIGEREEYVQREKEALQKAAQHLIKRKRKEVEAAFSQARKNESEVTWNDASRVAREISNYWAGVIQEIKTGSCPLALTEAEATEQREQYIQMEQEAVQAKTQYIIEDKRKRVEAVFAQARNQESESKWDEAARVARKVSDYWNKVIEETKVGKSSLSLTEAEAIAQREGYIQKEKEAIQAKTQFIMADKRKRVEAVFAQARNQESESTWNKTAMAAREVSDYWNGVIEEIKEGSSQLSLTESEATEQREQYIQKEKVAIQAKTQYIMADKRKSLETIFTQARNQEGESKWNEAARAARELSIYWNRVVEETQAGKSSLSLTVAEAIAQREQYIQKEKEALEKMGAAQVETQRIAVGRKGEIEAAFARARAAKNKSVWREAKITALEGAAAWDRVIEIIQSGRSTLALSEEEATIQRDFLLEKAGIAEVKALGAQPCGDNWEAKRDRADAMMTMIRNKVWPCISEAMKAFIAFPSEARMRDASASASASASAYASASASASASAYASAYASTVSKICAESAAEAADSAQIFEAIEESNILALEITKKYPHNFTDTGKENIVWYLQASRETANFARAVIAFKKEQEAAIVEDRRWKMEDRENVEDGRDGRLKIEDRKDREEELREQNSRTEQGKLAEIKALADSPCADNWEAKRDRANAVSKMTREKFGSPVSPAMKEFSAHPSEMTLQATGKSFVIAMSYSEAEEALETAEIFAKVSSDAAQLGRKNKIDAALQENVDWSATITREIVEFSRALAVFKRTQESQKAAS
ncbi:MAG TPA: hypothetical protein VJK54_05360 [Chthoniobacterales bacterium]|nr:hypothetical protein [Chthoniobacterales bacterium]